jgi:hypothetical protein
MVVDVRLSPMLLLDVSVRHVHVPDFGVVVLVAVSGEQVRPVLATMEIVRHVEMLVTVLQRFMVMTSKLSHSLTSNWPQRTAESARYIFQFDSVWGLWRLCHSSL